MSAAVADELGEAPPAAKEGISKMADAFRNKMAEAHPENAKRVPPQGSMAPPAPKPASAPAPAPAPPKEAKPVETPPAPTPAPKAAVEVDPTMPKNAKDWKAHNEVKDKAIAEAKQFKAEAEALKNETATLKAELDGLKKGTAEYERVKSEYEATKKERDDYKGLVNQVALELDPQFQAHFNSRRQMAVGLAKDIPTTPEQKAKLEQILSFPPSQQRNEAIEAFSAELNEFQRHRLASTYVQLEHVERERSMELSKSAENLEKAREVRMKQQQMEQAAQLAQQKTFVDTVHQRIDPELDGEDKSDIASFKEKMRKVATNSYTPDEFLEVAGYAAKGRKHDAVVNSLKEENAKLQAQVQELTAAQPGANGTGGAAPARKASTAPDQTGRQLGNKFREELAKRQAA